MFQKSVWEATRKIPRGRVATYAQIAQAIGRPLAVRAVGNALNKNTNSPKVPCHRVVKSNGSLGGFARGVKKKRELLKREGVESCKFHNDYKVKDFEKVLYKF
ncbi:MAG: MGMT family protein [Candidatus Falkowbacteria bacterium]|nr:MGMT family protein [Candidatus Falkowbacteria bacterium]